MKKIVGIIACCFFVQIASAQAPKWAEKAKKAVFSVVTYDKENKIKGTGNGFYIDAQGIALSDYSLFEGAERAVIINADGKQLDVNRIMGANSMYDVVKFNTAIDKKQMTLTIASQPAKVGETVYLLPYSTQKATTVQTGKVTAVDSIGNNSFYYTLEMKTGEKTISCPIMNANGEVLGLIQKNASEESTESYAIGAGYGASLSISALSMNDGALNKIGIKKALPDTEDQALVFLYMSSEQLDKDSYLILINDFLAQYPNSPEGYIRLANYYLASGDASQYALADENMKKALDVATQKDEAHYQVAKTIYSYMISLEEGQEAYKEWSYEKALELIRKAVQSSAQPIHIQLEGDILFAQGNYADAFEAYNKVNQTSFASAATFYSASKAKQLTEGSNMNEVLALMDSAIVKLSKPYFGEAAPYFYERAELRAQAGKFREAVMDYNTFFEAVSGDVTALFYFQREQAEMQCRMYQQALNDINKAVEMSPEDVDFLVEKGSVHLRVNQLDEAIATFQKAISMNDQYAAAYRMLGYCQAMQKKTKEACANFAKAKELGDTVVDQLIEKYCK
jgi:tetratricopeptide (TPR) repeat protein